MGWRFFVWSRIYQLSFKEGQFLLVEVSLVLAEIDLVYKPPYSKYGVPVFLSTYHFTTLEFLLRLFHQTASSNPLVIVIESILNGTLAMNWFKVCAGMIRICPAFTSTFLSFICMQAAPSKI